MLKSIIILLMSLGLVVMIIVKQPVATPVATPNPKVEVEAPFVTVYSEFYSMINQYRKDNGLTELKPTRELEASARLKGDVMAQLDCWSHYCPIDTSPWVYFDRAGYGYRAAGENLAVGYSDIREALGAWIESPTHKSNLDGVTYTEQGVYIRCGLDQKNLVGCVIVHHFGSRL